MQESFFRSLKVSIEWRIIAFFITNMFLWASTGEFWKATGLAFILQIILFTTYVFWHFFRQELKKPFFPGLKSIRSSK